MFESEVMLRFLNGEFAIPKKNSDLSIYKK